MATNVLSMHGIHRSYRTGPEVLHVLANLHLDVEQGEWVAILGSSGSGKSTLLNIMGLLDRPDSGTYLLDGTDVSTLGDADRAHARNRLIGFVFQQFNLIPRTPALHNVATPLLYARVPKRERLAAARNALDTVGLAERAHHQPTQLSGGQMQRVAIARALVTDPAVILADEPTGNLDARSGEELMTLFEDLHGAGRSIVMITHELDIASRADRQLTLADGALHPTRSNNQAPPEVASTTNE
jgi:putative ABC transport system ATP-binding protein